MSVHHVLDTFSKPDTYMYIAKYPYSIKYLSVPGEPEGTRMSVSQDIDDELMGDYRKGGGGRQHALS